MDVVHLNQKQLAARWCISVATLERWSGNLPFEERGYSPHILANAIHFAESAVDFHGALELSLQHAGGANYSPVMVGAYAGALYQGPSESIARAVHGDDLVDSLTAGIWQHP